MLQVTASYNISEIIKAEGYTRGYISQAAGMFSATSAGAEPPHFLGYQRWVTNEKTITISSI